VRHPDPYCEEAEDQRQTQRGGNRGDEFDTVRVTGTGWRAGEKSW